MIGRTFRPGDSITKEEMFNLFKEDLVKHEAAIDKYPQLKIVYNQLNLPRKMMLIQMCFQMGNAGVAKFKNTLQKMSDQDWRGAYEGLLASAWASQTPARAKRVAAVMYEGNLEPYVGYMKSHGF
jgi:predicted secreted protein